MTKQEEIREGIACRFVEVIYRKGWITWETMETEKTIKQMGYEFTDEIIRYEASRGVVLKVEGGLLPLMAKERSSGIKIRVAKGQDVWDKVHKDATC